MCQVSFSDPFLLSRRRDTNVAGTGLSRERPGSATTIGIATAGAAGEPDGAGRRLVQFLVQRFQHPGGFLAAGDAEIEPRLGLAGDRLGIVVAIIAALAAILLRHRRHHAPAQRTAFGELHAVGNRHGLVVPRRFAVVAIAGRRQHTAPFCSGESGVEPSSESIPTRKPFSQERCPSENGAVGGMISSRGGGVIWFMALLPLQRVCVRIRRHGGAKR